MESYAKSNSETSEKVQQRDEREGTSLCMDSQYSQCILTRTKRQSMVTDLKPDQERGAWRTLFDVLVM